MQDELTLETARILAVDDEPVNLLVLERLLAQAGCTHVTSLSDSRTVMAQLDDLRPDLILLDLHMPHLDGNALLTEIRANHDSSLPVIILTADITPQARHRALAAGAHDFLTKPFDAGEVLLRIRNFIEMRRLHLALKAQNEVLDAAVQERTRDLHDSLRRLERADAHRRRLVNSLVSAQEEERKRIASEVHDDSIQVMAATVMRMGLLRRRQVPPEIEVELDKLQSVAELAISRLRRLVFQLRPPSLDRYGLAAAINEYLREWADEAGVEFHVENHVKEEASQAMRATMFRIAQEALTNVRKHAAAGRVEVVVEDRDPGVFARIQDDGVGVAPSDVLLNGESGHLGLATMRERAELAGGWCRIARGDTGGTVVEVWVPRNDEEGLRV